MTTTEIAAREHAQLVTHDVIEALGLDRRRPETKALLILAERYQLDPVLGHVAIVKTKNGSKPYITHGGMLEVAHRSGQLDGIVVEEERETENGWAATVSVYRRDMRHPFTYSAGCGRQEQQGQAGHGAAMALARAERRALRRAFSIPLEGEVDADAFDEVDEQEPSQAWRDAVAAVTSRVEALDDEQRAAFVGWKDDQGFPYPWSVEVLAALHAELDSIEAGVTDADVVEPEYADDEEPF
jgi:hypothetical protein